MALAAHAMDSDFVNLNLAWSGRLFMQREIYQERRSGEYFVALSFLKFAGLSLPCSTRKIGGFRYIFPDCSRMTCLHWIVSPGFKDDFLHIPTKVVPPACIPSELGIACAAIKVGEPQPLLQAALKTSAQIYSGFPYMCFCVFPFKY